MVYGRSQELMVTSLRGQTENATPSLPTTLMVASTRFFYMPEALPLGT